MSASEMLETFSGALQGTISVLLTLLAGYATAYYGYCNRGTVKQISKMCTSLFLPCLIIEQMGPELTAKQLSSEWIIPVWGFASTAIGHAIGWLGHRTLKLPHWVIVACGRPNSNALPILLLQSLQQTGVLDLLAKDGESLSQTVSRSKSLLLLNAIIQQTLTFQFAPSVLALDSQSKGQHNPENPNTLHPGPGRLLPVVQDPERVGLLAEQDGTSYGSNQQHDEPIRALHEIEDVIDYHWPPVVAPLEKPIKKVFSYMSPPLIGALLALVIGLTPALHHVFYDKNGALYTSITQSIENLGELFVVLQTFIVGAELALVPHAKPNKVATTYILLIRFIVMPAISLLFVWASAGRGIYVDDPLVWFLLVIIPSGPSAMLLISVAELVDLNQGIIAGYLLISYLFSPVMAVVCSAALQVVEIAKQR